MEVFELMVTSLMVNVCVLIVVIATWMVGRRPAAGVPEQRLNAGREELETKTASLVPDDHLGQKTSICHNAPQSNATEVHIMSSIITSSFCSIAGLYLTTSPYIWESPFVSTQHSHTDAVSPPGSNHVPNNDDRVWSRHEAASTVLLSATFGCFIFALFHLAIVCNQSRKWSLWTVFRVGYLFITMVTFIAIINTKENLLGASLILLMEADATIEGICRLVDICPIGKHVRTARILLSIVGCVTSVGTRIVMTWAMCILLGKMYNPIAMSVISLGISSFGFIFYQAYALLVIKKHVDRLKMKSGDKDVKKMTDSTAVDAYMGKFRCLGGKAVAFHLMNEGLIEISTYAKTVAGLITAKKLMPIKNLCDNFAPIKSDSSLPRN